MNIFIALRQKNESLKSEVVTLKFSSTINCYELIKSIFLSNNIIFTYNQDYNLLYCQIYELEKCMHPLWEMQNQ